MCDLSRQRRIGRSADGEQRLLVVEYVDIDDAHALATLLNSSLVAAWLNSIAEPARGGYRRYLGWTLSLLPVPVDWIRARNLLAPLGEGTQGVLAPALGARLGARLAPQLAPLEREVARWQRLAAARG